MAHGFECLTEVTGTEGRITVGGEGRFDHVVIADAHGVRHESTPTFYERFEDAFLREDAEFVQAVLEDRSSPLTLRDATEATRIARRDAAVAARTAGRCRCELPRRIGWTVIGRCAGGR